MKSKTTAGLLALFLGGLGIHKFYLGQGIQGALYLFFCWTGIPLLISFFEGISYFLMAEQKFNALYNGGAVAAIAGPQVTQAQNVVVNMALPAPHQHQPQVDVAGQLQKLNELRISGALSDQEFQTQKVKLLQSGESRSP